MRSGLSSLNMQDRSKNFTPDSSLKFPQVLMLILDNPAYNSIIAWLPHGEGFKIYDKRKFASEIIPLYFRKSHYTSFTRKLNRWGFSRICKGPENGAYYHKLFKRGDEQLCSQMHCLTMSNDAHAAQRSPRNENLCNVSQPQDTDSRSKTSNIAPSSPGNSDLRSMGITNNVVSNDALYNLLLQQQQFLKRSAPLCAANSFSTDTSKLDGTSIAEMGVDYMTNDTKFETEMHMQAQKQKILIEAHLRLALLKNERMLQEQALLSSLNDTGFSMGPKLGLGCNSSITNNPTTLGLASGVEGMLELASLQNLLNLKTQQQSIATATTSFTPPQHLDHQFSVPTPTSLDTGNVLLSNLNLQRQQHGLSLLNENLFSNKRSEVSHGADLNKLLMDKILTDGTEPKFRQTNKWTNNSANTILPGSVPYDTNYRKAQHHASGRLQGFEQPETFCTAQSIPFTLDGEKKKLRAKRRSSNASAA